MSIKSLLFKGVLVLGSAGLLAGAASAASASTGGTVSANTHINQNPDTTSVSGGATITTGAGYVWAYDNLTMKFTAVPESNQPDGAN
jgi:hypothetical protein